MPRGVGGRGPANIAKHLKGIKFPKGGITRADITAHAKQATGPDTEEVIAVLEKIEDRRYHSPAEVLKAVGKVE